MTLYLFPTTITFTQSMRQEDGLGELTHYTYRPVSTLIYVLAPDRSMADIGIMRAWKRAYPDIVITGGLESIPVDITMTNEPHLMNWYREKDLRVLGPERATR